MSYLLPEFTAFAHMLADAAGDAIRPLFRTAVAVDVKPDESPVTIADRQAERVMREMIMQRYPDHGIWGEEEGRHQADAKYCWVLDPVDGTKSFIAGIATFGTLISLVRLGVPVLGLIDQPIQRERWIASGTLPATLNKKPVHTRTCARLAQATLSTTSPLLFNTGDKARFEKAQQQAHYTIYGHDCYAYAQLASGRIDAVIETGLKPHDFCALRPVIEGAGGLITDWEGRLITTASDGRVVASGDARLHDELLSILR